MSQRSRRVTSAAHTEPGRRGPAVPARASRHTGPHRLLTAVVAFAMTLSLVMLPGTTQPAHAEEPEPTATAQVTASATPSPDESPDTLAAPEDQAAAAASTTD